MVINMNFIEFRNMEPRERDLLVGEHVFGWTQCIPFIGEIDSEKHNYAPSSDGDLAILCEKTNHVVMSFNPWTSEEKAEEIFENETYWVPDFHERTYVDPFSSDIEYAWKVVEKMLELGGDERTNFLDSFQYDEILTEESGACLNICWNALKTVGVFDE